MINNGRGVACVFLLGMALAIGTGVNGRTVTAVSRSSRVGVVKKTANHRLNGRKGCHKDGRKLRRLPMPHDIRRQPLQPASRYHMHK
ncbi:hypothetical protein PQ472_11665 [Lacticaseibacillus pabuli]|uniref:Secreted protein n=1 Tax=Lacticaseibacillus pabuli TaxID=3025672 RepID=A0ABY7WQR8_9LACO|nr:hypothetical protein [Lacticaseibacillus sp. KACC 23028]WDF82533.1 hypothetical protein PQ472_11665 [Lacticaseibacillus sp. KACC 23028]